MLCDLWHEAESVTLAIFDLDNTLIGGDSDHLWSQFLVEENIVNDADFAERGDRFHADYERGDLDIHAYLRYALGPLRGQPEPVLAEWHRQFMRTRIRPVMLPRAAELLEQHRAQGHVLLIITATNHFITRPIADALGVDHLLACDAEILNGFYTGEPRGVPTFQAGKVTRLRQWLETRDIDIEGAWFYSDSHNDLPLLELVDNPVAVDPDERLRARAEAEGWPIISLRD